MSIYYVLSLFITKLYLYQKFGINFFVIFFNTIFAADKYIYDIPKALITKKKQKNERRGSIRGQPIIVREIVTLI